MKQIDVLKQALEALESCSGVPHWPAFQPTITTLRQAIEQAEKQEPVALKTVYETIIQWDEGGGKRSRRELARRIVALYTTPPVAQRQPLTDERIALIAAASGGLASDFVITVARAIEAAHGITGEKK